LDEYVQGFKDEASLAADAAAEHLREATRAEARRRPGWDTMADSIEVWAQDGEMVVGVLDNALTSQAFALEYGDETSPPNPLFRTLGSVVQEADDVYANHLADRGVADR
jgi:hypothetical protein